MAKRHDEWAHTHVVGNDRAAAAPYLPDARKLLGMVTEDAAHNKLQTHQMTRRYEDGAVVVAEIRGGIPRMTIAPPAVSGKPKPARVRGGFVMWPRSDSYINGFNILQPTAWMASLDTDQWAINYFDRTDPPWSALARPRGIYGEFPDGTPMFPDGLYLAGNVDWIGSSNERLSWYGPRTRYAPTFYDQTGKAVYHLGRKLLDVGQYASANARPELDGWVLGAAMRDGFLYVFTASDVAYRDAGPSTHALARYRLHKEPVTQGVGKLRVAADDGESGAPVVLWTAPRDRSMAPYFFNASVTEASRVGYTVANDDDSDDFNELLTVTIDLADDTVTTETTATNFVIAITYTPTPVTEDGVNYLTESALAAPVSALVARDYRGDRAVDVVAHLRTYVSTPRQEVEAATTIIYFERNVQIAWKIGALDLVLVDQHERVAHSNEGGFIAKPNELLGTIAHRYILAMDARFDSAVVIQATATYFGNLWALGLLADGGMEASTAVFAGGNAPVSLSPLVLPVEPFADGNDFNARVGAKLQYASGPVGFNAAILPLFGQASVTIGYDNASPSFDRFIDISDAAWEPALIRDASVYKHAASLACIDEPQSYLFAGLDALHPGMSLSHSPSFDAVERTAITGARPRLHPVWVLGTVHQEQAA